MVGALDFKAWFVCCKSDSIVAIQCSFCKFVVCLSSTKPRLRCTAEPTISQLIYRTIPLQIHHNDKSHSPKHKLLAQNTSIAQRSYKSWRQNWNLYKMQIAETLVIQEFWPAGCISAASVSSSSSTTSKAAGLLSGFLAQHALISACRPTGRVSDIIGLASCALISKATCNPRHQHSVGLLHLEITVNTRRASVSANPSTQ